ncbi:PLP-dependent aminotransferase family protein [Desulfovibrio mangrovi]|uniref:MocR-like pyridoxine biosynthesis transcription factor PdxR n=1 Tax=Desulfovibrio mangrovi TaxID=2976983 RepID=UPI002248237E|nr:PLP-dependent aminotransferase family protein [Desulfovibrio mangrovi]UZP66520.1 PLP-dependent aminotransferase family protein [Desulfovibrio mangrovi]
MRIPLDRESGSPLYSQIAAFIREGIESHALPAGMRLPAIRKLALELGVNRITVENAYAELEAAGLLAARVGSGTFILPPFPDVRRSPAASRHTEASTKCNTKCDTWPAWQQTVVERFSSLPAKPPIPLLTHSPDRNIISLNCGNSDPALYPLDELRASLRDTLRKEGTDAGEYADMAGYAPLRRTISHVLADQGIPAATDDIIITSGSQQALALVTQLLTRHGDTVVTEGPSYADGMDLFRARGLNIIQIPMDAEGMRMDKLEEALRAHSPKLIFTMPNFQNPTGICMSGQRRRQLVQLAAAYAVPLVEDDFVGDLRYEGHAQPALKALAAKGACFYMGTFSKMLMPGLRVGYMVAEGPVRDLLVRCKRLNDISSSGVIQRALYRFVSVGRHRTHLSRSCSIYRRRRDALLAACAEYLPEDITVSPVTGGLFAWCTLPPDLTATAVTEAALNNGVAVAPGTAFFLNPADGERFLRLNVTLHDAEVIREAMRRLGRACETLRQQQDAFAK